MKKTTNIRDIAKSAQVSIATVSRYINKRGYVSDVAVEKIKKAIKQTGYVPNELARSLFRKNSKTIGVLVPNIANPLFNQLVLHIEKKARVLGYSVFLSNTDDNAEKETSALNVLMQNRVAGIITVRSHCTTEYKHIAIPVVAGENHIAPHIPVVACNDELGGRLAFKHLYECGCKKLLHIKGPHTFEATEARCRGFLLEAKKKKIECDTLELSRDFYETILEDEIERLHFTKRYDGIFVFNDITAAAIMRRLISLGISIPRQTKVIGFDNSFLGKLTSPSLSTIEQPIEELAEKMISLLFSRIGKKTKLSSKHVEDYFAKPRLIVRESTKEK